MIFSENRFPLFGIMLYYRCGASPALSFACGWAAEPASARPWTRRPAPGAASGRRSCSRAAPPAPPVRTAPTDRAPRTSPDARSGRIARRSGSNRFTPCFSSTLSNSRSVNSTPSSSALVAASAVLPQFRIERLQRPVHIVGDRREYRGRRRKSRSARVSAISRSVRRRRFSISAKVRSSLSLYSAASRTSSATGSISGAAASAPASAGYRPFRACCGRAGRRARGRIRHRA